MAEEEKEEEEPAASQEDEYIVVNGVRQMREKKPFTDEEAESTIAEFMEKQNRPYSVQNLLDSYQH